MLRRHVQNVGHVAATSVAGTPSIPTFGQGDFPLVNQQIDDDLYSAIDAVHVRWRMIVTPSRKPYAFEPD